MLGLAFIVDKKGEVERMNEVHCQWNLQIKDILEQHYQFFSLLGDYSLGVQIVLKL